MSDESTLSDEIRAYLRWEWSPDEPNLPLDYPAVWSTRPGAEDTPVPWRVLMHDEEAVYVREVDDPASGRLTGPTYRLPIVSLPDGAEVPELPGIRFYQKLPTACMRSFFGPHLFGKDDGTPRPQGYEFRPEPRRRR